MQFIQIVVGDVALWDSVVDAVIEEPSRLLLVGIFRLFESSSEGEVPCVFYLVGPFVVS